MIHPRRPVRPALLACAVGATGLLAIIPPAAPAAAQGTPSRATAAPPRKDAAPPGKKEVPPAGKDAPVDPPGVSRRTLPSGLRVVVAERPAGDVVALDLRVRAGSADPPSGVAHALEHLVFKGTVDRTPGEIDDAIERLGGELGARTFRDATQYAVTVPSGTWRDALALVSEMVLRPALRPEDLDAERPVLRDEMALAAGDPVRAGVAALVDRLYPDGDPYRMPLMGLPADLDRIDADALRAFHTAFYRPERMSLVVVGPVDPEEVFAAAAAFFDGAKASPAVRPARSAPSVPPAAPVRLPSGTQLTALHLGWRAPSAAEPDALAAWAILAELLVDPEVGPVSEAMLGERGPVLSVGSDHLIQRAGGMLVLTVVTRAADAAATEADILSALARWVPSEVGDGAIEAARRAALARISAEEATADTLARRLAFTEGVDAPGLENVLRVRIEKTPAGAVRDALRRLVAPGTAARVVFGPDPIAGEGQP